MPAHPSFDEPMQFHLWNKMRNKLANSTGTYGKPIGKNGEGGFEPGTEGPYNVYRVRQTVS
jgi:hypothetical protein